MGWAELWILFDPEPGCQLGLTLTELLYSSPPVRSGQMWRLSPHCAHCPSVARPPGSSQSPSHGHVRFPGPGLQEWGGTPLSPSHRYDSGLGDVMSGEKARGIQARHGWTPSAWCCITTASATILGDSCLSSISRTSCRPSPLMSSGFSVCAPATGQVSWPLGALEADRLPGVSPSRWCGCLLAPGLTESGGNVPEKHIQAKCPRQGCSSQSPWSHLPIHAHVTEISSAAQQVPGQLSVEPVQEQGPNAQAALRLQHCLPLVSFRAHKAFPQ